MTADLSSHLDEDPLIFEDNMHWTIIQCQKLILRGASLFACELFYRILCIIYEYNVNWRNYEPDNRFRQVCIFSLAKYHVSMRYTIMVAVPIILIMQGHDKHVRTYIFHNFAQFALPYVLLRSVNFTYSNLELAEFIRGGSGLDYATGMASNYFHGYLHLQLPETGHRTKAGLQERIEDYESTENVTIPIKKLFILIPQSMYTKPEIDSKIMIPARGLETVTLDRAGVKRPFKNQVYRISGCGPHRNREWYVVLEGATPMMSFYEVLQQRLTATEEMVDMKREITLKFYRALKNIVTNCPDTKDLVELIYYSDVTSDGRDVDVGEIVRERIHTLMRKDKIEVFP